MKHQVNSWWRSVVDQANEELAKRRQVGEHSIERAPLTDEDYASFDVAVSKREEPVPLKNQYTLFKLLREKNFVRWHRMRADFRWALKLAKKHGYTTEEVWWLLREGW